MTLVTLKSILSKANKEFYAVGAFNINNMEFIQAIINACEKERSPAIIQTSQGAIKYAGIENILALVKTAAKKTKCPIALHLDHGTDMDFIKLAINSGYTSVMIDASHYPYKENIAMTKKVVKLAHKKGISVEAELGTIGGAEEQVVSRKIVLADPEKCLEFAKLTKIDALAAAIGTSHGVHKFKGKSRLDFKNLVRIKEKTKMPLVLHGASGIPPEIVKKAKKYGAKLEKAHGVQDKHIKKAVKLGINKVNIDSDLRLTFLASVRETLQKKPATIDPRKYLGPAREAVQELIQKKMLLLGSGGKAR